LILEPLIQCAAGMAMHHPIYVTRAREICSKYQVHLIADEIAVGFGRTGTLFACEQARVTPDFLCLSKGISGGYLPLSVTLTTEDVYQAFYDESTTRGFLHSHSYTGNALACSAALATLDIFAEEAVLEQNLLKAEYLNHGLQSFTDLPIRNLRNTGMIWAFEVETQQSAFARDFYAAALKQGVLLRPIGNTVYFMPPYVITNDEIDHLLAQTRKLLEMYA
ncbi:MAG TPA: aminotransferase class III-fold pyridoxal phosphate-dependent enzyme, partial [Methylophilaceae bacterium]|nr:aminotransferase class III-fold pyridoxal phosphate-dependent enzyme [Methylophilaceae bacterium]